MEALSFPGPAAAGRSGVNSRSCFSGGIIVDFILGTLEE